MKRFLSLIAVTLIILTGCGNSAPTQKDLEKAGFSTFGDSGSDYNHGYSFESPDEEYILNLGLDTNMLGYLAFSAESPNDFFEAYVPFSKLGQDITTSTYNFVDYYGDDIDEVDFTNDYYGIKSDFESSEYNEQWDIFERFIVENFDDEDALDNEFNFQQEVA